MPLPVAGEFPTGAVLRGLIAALLKETAAFAQVATTEGTTSTTFTDLATAGPAVTLVSAHDRALILWATGKFSNNAGSGAGCVVQISGATTLAASENNGANQATGLLGGFGHENMQFMIATINPGSNTYTLKYNASANTASFYRRRLYVIAP